jgi:hypothetical protein
MTDVVADPVSEAQRVLRAADEAGVPLRAMGGIAVALIAPSIADLHPRRTYHDIDLAALPGAPAVSRLMTDLGYTAAQPFNTLNGSERLLFHDAGGRRVDVFVETLRMCHTLPFGTRLELRAWTLPPADLVLSKLQIVELTDRDAQDLVALLADHPLTPSDADGIGLGRIQQICGGDWGWWRTVDDNLRRLSERWQAARAVTDSSQVQILERAIERATALRAVLETCPKSLGWTIRAKVGPRLRWYDLPEEVR